MLFKNLTSVNSRKKDITLKEVFENNGVIAKTERRSFYLVKDVRPLDEKKDIQKWLDSQKNTGLVGKRHFHITREHSDALCEDRVICRITGTFYAVVDKKVYTVAFLNSFRARFAKTTSEK